MEDGVAGVTHDLGADLHDLRPQVVSDHCATASSRNASVRMK
jgi:hypothetical protein